MGVCALLFLSGAAWAKAPLPVQGTAPTEAVSEAAAEPPHAEHDEGLPQGAPLLIDTQYFKFNSSMLITWCVALALIISAKIATWHIKDVPEGAQNFWEWLVECLYNFLQNLIGPVLVRQTFWFFATIFIFILTL